MQYEEFEIKKINILECLSKTEEEINTLEELMKILSECKL